MRVFFFYRVIRSLFIFASIWSVIVARQNNEVYPLPLDKMSSEILNNNIQTDEDFDELRNFFMMNVEDRQICLIPELKELIVKKNGNGIGWWSRRCLAMSGGVKVVKEQNTSKQNNLQFNKKVKKRLNSLLRKSACQPVKKVVELQKESNSSLGLEYVPCSVQVKRCSGCCNSDMLVCKPVKIRHKSFTVLGLTQNKVSKRSPSSRYSMPKNTNFLYKIKVIEHLTCECQCQETESDCTPAQKYEAHLCKCVCPESTKKTCENGKVWSHEGCSCVCQRRKDCTTGMIFNTNSCSCEVADEYRIPYFEYGK